MPADGRMHPIYFPLLKCVFDVQTHNAFLNFVAGFCKVG